MAKVSGLGHVGISVQDMDKMLDFYTRVMGLTVTDGGDPGKGVFLSGHPETEHHEFVMGPSPDRRTNAQQISFKVDTLGDLRSMYRDLRDYGISTFRITNHGIAFGCYFRDPEDNNVEVYWSTGVDYPQPHGEPIDLDSSEEELLKVLENMTPKDGSMPRMYGKDVGKRLRN